jgi:hypothetical protein
VLRALVIVLVAGCGRIGFEAAPDTGASGDASMSHLTVAPGWHASVFVDFSSQFVYQPADFVDATDTYDNEPSHLIATHIPYAPALLVTAGRHVLEITPTSFVDHDYGNHVPDTTGRPDALQAPTMAFPTIGQGRVLLTSSSPNTGDGVFVMTTAFSLTTESNFNNVLSVVYDAGGLFDARGTDEVYLGTLSQGVVRESDMATNLVPGIIRTIRRIGSDMMITREVADDDQRLVRVTSGTHAEIPIAQARTLRLGQGDPPAPGVAWVVVDRNALEILSPSGELDTVASHDDPNAAWQASVVPIPLSGLAGPTARVFVLESNITAGVFRVLLVEHD